MATPSPQAGKRDMVSRELTVRAESLNVEERSVEAVLATSDRVVVFDWQRYESIEEVLIVEGIEHDEQVVLLEQHEDHSTRTVLGSIRQIRTETGQLIGRLFFAAGDENAERVWNLVQQGHLRDVSIGYRPFKNGYTDIEPGRTQRVDGQEYTAGAMRLRITKHSKMREGSIVVIGADDSAKTRSSAESQQEAIVADEQKNENATPQQPAETQPKPTERSEPVKPIGNDGSALMGENLNEELIRAQAKREERARIEMCRELATDDIPDEVVERAIADGWDEARINQEYLKALRSAKKTNAVSTGAPAVHSRASEADLADMTLAAALMGRCGTSPDALCKTESDKKAWERAMNDGERYQRWSLMKHCERAVDTRNVKDPSTGLSPDSDEGYVRAALSTLDVSNVFTTNVHARLIGAYDLADDSTDWVEVRDVPNFKQQDDISMGQMSGLKKLARGGKAEHAEQSDEVENFRIARFAEQVVLDEMDIIDENLGAFQTISQELGEQAAQLRPDLVYSLLLENPSLDSDSTAVFHANHNNTDTNALSIANLKTAITTMMKQQQGNRNLNIKPEYLIVNSDLQLDAEEILGSTQVVIAGDTDAVRGSVNVVAGKLKIRGDARLTNGVVDPDSGASRTGSSTTWFLASRAFRTVVVAYRTGTGRRPRLRRTLLTQGQWGIAWDINMDIGADFLGYRGLYRGNI